MDDAIASDPALRASGVQARAARASSAPPARQVADQPPLISIGAPAELDLLDPTYAYLYTYCSACLDPRLAQRLNVAIYELYANALRYGSGKGEVRLEIWHSPNGSGVVLRISNHAEPATLERLKAHIARVRADPSAAFASEMNRFADASQPPPMLGIVRVAHEAALDLHLRIDHDRVEISTVCDV